MVSAVTVSLQRSLYPSFEEFVSRLKTSRGLLWRVPNSFLMGFSTLHCYRPRLYPGPYGEQYVLRYGSFLYIKFSTLLCIRVFLFDFCNSIHLYLVFCLNFFRKVTFFLLWSTFIHRCVFIMLWTSSLLHVFILNRMINLENFFINWLISTNWCDAPQNHKHCNWFILQTDVLVNVFLGKLRSSRWRGKGKMRCRPVRLFFQPNEGVNRSRPFKFGTFGTVWVILKRVQGLVIGVIFFFVLIYIFM